MNATAAALAVQGLDVRLGHGAHARWALQGVSLAVPQAAWTSIVGPNGAGKSTLLRALAGLVPPSAGSVYLLGRPLAQWARRERAQALAWLGQGEATPDDLTVYDVALLGRLPHQPWLAPPTPADHAAVAQALQATGAWHWRARTLGQLSGGERQRVLLARALAVQAQVLLMDEPLTHLDPPHQADWLQLVRTLVAQGTTVVSVLHEVSVALQADHIAVLAAGRVLHHGPSSASAAHRAVEQVFDHRIAIHAVAGQWVALPHIPSPLTK